MKRGYMQIIKNIPKLKPRRPDAHKGDFGKVCIIGGCIGMSGAPALAGRAALRAGAGLVRVAVPESILPIVASIEPSYTTIPLAEDSSGRISAKATNTILDAVSENDCLAFGPGIGTSGGIQSILETLLEQKQLRLLIDADGLNNLSGIKDWPDKLKADLILTPHPGEMKRLWSGLFRETLPSDRQDQASKFAKHTKTIVVLKGAGTVVTDGKKVYINKTGNPGMATAGAGDCLTGVITALVGQSLGNFDAAVLGVYIHGLAGDIAAEKYGQISLIATDIIDSLPKAFLKK
ncbi:MAG: NAD(P)H-hydrate dehydratase [Phycisphaerae bacterium]|nr:NAD(P)H-hydrate dehydratase [Phycisphaerae bacterium]MDD5381596.1 NAD(P)H-hydrate dehydratase [Phycisphaerae bacterium]